jgi:tetratricopeptide (TPR) repeat protein
MTLLQTDYWTNGLTLFTRAVEVAPTNVRARNLLANQLFKAGDAPDALALYDGSLQLEPNLWETNFAAGVTLYSTGQLAPAEHWLRRACELDRTNALGFLFLSDVLRAENRADEAQQVLRDGLATADSQQELLRQKLAGFAAAQ